MSNKILRISGTGDYQQIAKAIESSGLLKNNRSYSHAFKHDIEFKIDATKGVQQQEIIDLLTAKRMQISSSEIVEGTVPFDSDAYED